MIHIESEQTLTTELSVSEVLEKICVRRPYFAYNQIIQTADGQSLYAPIKREQPMGAERGVMAAAEIGRHLAILGSCAASRLNQHPGPHYYLAWSAHLKLLVDHGIELPTEDLIGRARATFVDKRTANAEAQLIHEPTGLELYNLSVHYQVLPKKLFERSFANRRTNTPAVEFNPYAELSPSLGDVFVLDDLLSANLQPLDPSACAGHFPDYPALPVAILAHILISAAGKLYASMIGVENAPYTVVDAKVESHHLAFADDGLHLVIQHKFSDDVGPNLLFRCRAVSEGREQRPFGDLQITLRAAD